MYSNERVPPLPPPQREALPSLSQILSPDNTPNLAGYYTPRSHHQSPPLPPLKTLESPRESSLSTIRGSSAHYHHYQAPPPPSPSHDRTRQDIQRYHSPLQNAHPPLPTREPQYALSSDSDLDHQRRQSFPDQFLGGRLTNGVHHTPSLTPSHQTPTHSYPPPLQRSGEPQPRLPPRVVDEQYVTGEGICYVYEDGTRCQKYIDGENVNPQWGVTKAGKPRKRLAQACTTCREKKIKCDPSSPKCLQCQKFNRECKFESAPRGHHHLSSNFAPNMARPGVREGGYGGPIPDAIRDSMSSRGSVKRSAEDGQDDYVRRLPAMEAQDEMEAKKQRRGSASSSSEPSHQRSKQFKGNLRTSDDRLMSSTAALEQTALEWKSDPWDVDADSANYYMKLYFDHVNTSTYCMFPRKPFIQWCQTCRTKSADDNMLIYSMLVMGSVFSNQPDRQATIHRLSSIAEYAVQQNRTNFSLQLVQSRLLLALLHFSLGNSQKAWDYCGAGVRAACGMRLNNEESVIDVPEGNHLEYGLNRVALEECRRRTFWSAFIMDRFNGFCSGHLSMIQIDDCFLRLPINEAQYEAQAYVSPSPFLLNNLIDSPLCTANDPGSLGSMAHLVNISAIWGEALAFTYRSSYNLSSTYGQHYETLYSTLMSRLASWQSNLPRHLIWSLENLDASIHQSYIGTYISLHCLYHCTILKLNRHVHVGSISPDSLKRNIHLLRHHSLLLLQATRALAKIDRDARLSSQSPSEVQFAFSTPFTGYAILTAIDVISSAGSLETLPEIVRLIDSSLEVVEELASFWASAVSQYRLIGYRLRVLTDIMAEYEGDGVRSSPESASVGVIGPGRDTHSGENVNGTGGPVPRRKAWVISEPLDNVFKKDQDVVYCWDRQQYLSAIGVDITPDDVVFIEGGGRA